MSLDQATADFSEVRPRLFGIAYRMLGSASDAEDVVQDAWVRWQSYDRAKVRDPAAFLATTTTRLAINASQSAHSRRETYIGPWLPEPVDTAADPALGAETGAVLEIAVLALLERLPPTERAAYVLREAFDYPYSEIAEIVEVSEPNARQLVSRARKHLESERRATVTPEEQDRLLHAFIDAAQEGDLEQLEELFTTDIVSHTDGGGITGASRTPLIGRERVAKVFAKVADKFWVDTRIDRIEVNGQPAALITREGGLVALLVLEAGPQGIHRLLWMMNPEKLSAVEGHIPG